MLDGNKYNNNLYAITDFIKTKGKRTISNIEKITKIFLKYVWKLNFLIFNKNIKDGKKFINHIKIAPFASPSIAEGSFK